MAKRGLSGKSLIVGVDKPAGMTSHDVVDICRRIYGERRVGHAGTLDPEATGILVVCIGPASRLNHYLTSQDKTYDFNILFGSATDTDDAQGQIIHTSDVPAQVRDAAYAKRILEGFLGAQKQMPPAFSAIKVDGRKACDQARAGSIIKLEPRDITIHSLELLSIEADDEQGVVWTCRARVSKGTYIRALARDIGRACDCFAHVFTLLRRVSVNAGALCVDECASVEVLREHPDSSILDPVRLMGHRVFFVDEALRKKVENGVELPAQEISLFEYEKPLASFAQCSCTSGLYESNLQPVDGELISMVADNKLIALYEYKEQANTFKSKCGLAIGVQRGAAI